MAMIAGESKGSRVEVGLMTIGHWPGRGSIHLLVGNKLGRGITYLIRGR